MTYPATAVFLILVLAMAYLWFKERRGIPFYFMAVWAVYLSNFRWRGSGDVAGASLIPFSLFWDGTIYLNRFSETILANPAINCIYSFKGHLLSQFSSANGILLIPFYAVSALLKVQPTDVVIHQLQKIGASFYTAASVLFIYLILIRSVRKPWALFLAAAYAFGTASWSTSSQAIWQHGPSQFFLSLGLYALLLPEGSPFLAGFALAMAVWCRYTDLLFYIPLWLWVMFHSRRKSFPFMMGSLLPVVGLLADNVLHTGHLFLTGHQMAGAINLGTPIGVGLSGLLVSPGRGLFLFSPFLIAAFFGMAQEVKNPKDSFYRYLALAVAANMIFYAKFHDWDGGWCFGPRTLADACPLLILFIPPLIPLFEKRIKIKRLFQFVVGYSILVHGMGAYLSWWWEDVPNYSVWRATAYPPLYLLRHLASPSPQDQFISAWAMIIIFILLASWYIRKNLAQNAS